MVDGGFTEKVREAARKRILILPHAIHQMTSIERMISTDEVKAVILKGDLIEDYPEDRRGHSCLMLGFGDDGRPVHVTCVPKDEYLAVITTYVPDADKWSSDFKGRM